MHLFSFKFLPYSHLALLILANLTCCLTKHNNNSNNNKNSNLLALLNSNSKSRNAVVADGSSNEIRRSTETLDATTSSSSAAAAASSIESFIINQKPLDCHHFATDLIECFAYNLFLKNAHKFQDLNAENVLIKPILTKQYVNQTAKLGQNVTFTCQTQIDAMPIFLFYKLSKNIIQAYSTASSGNNNNNNNKYLLNRYAQPLQDPKSFSDYASINPRRFVLERREHVDDSNKDVLSDLETVNLHIINASEDDAGYYLCIVANSMKSFRLTYAYLAIETTPPVASVEASTIHAIQVISSTQQQILKFLTENKLMLGVGIGTAVILAVFCMAFFALVCCKSCCKRGNRRMKNSSLNKDNNNHLIKHLEFNASKASLDSSKVNSIIEKTMNSMKKNFMYVSMPASSRGNHSPSGSSTNTTTTTSIITTTPPLHYDDSLVAEKNALLCSLSNTNNTNANVTMASPIQNNLFLFNKVNNGSSSRSSSHDFFTSPNNVESTSGLVASANLFPNRIDFEFLDDYDESCLSLTSWEFPREKLKFGRLIDEGAFGRVYMADAYGIIPGRYKTVVAIKMLKDNATKNEFINFVKELEIMKNVGKHENIISLLGCCTKSGPLFAIVEYAKFGNLRNYLRKQRSKDYMLCNGLLTTDELGNDEDEELSLSSGGESNSLTNNILKLYSSVNKKKMANSLTTNSTMSTFGSINEKKRTNSIISKEDLQQQQQQQSTENTELSLMIDLIKFCAQIASGMRYLHSKKVCHRDLAARNILLDEFKVCKIADFGFARDLHQNYYYKRKSEAPIPVKWMAPETLFDRKVYQNSDVWSFGVLMWEVFSLGANPYPSVQIEKLFEYLKEGNRMSKPMYSDDEIYQLMLDCWNFKSDMRPSFDAINGRLGQILEKYELRQAQSTCQNSKLFDEKTLNELKHVSNLFKKTNSSNSNSNNLHTSLTINPNNVTSVSDHPSISSSSTASYAKKQAEISHHSEMDSQYFSGNSSLLYADTSQFSSAASNYTNYSVASSDAAVKAASLMAASIAQHQTPPSPPPLKPLSRLLNVASAAYQL